MKFPLSWLRTHLDTGATPEEIGETLTRIGLELESLDHPGAALASFRVARVLEAAQHPNADRLRVCKVDTGNGITTVVCGAPNARTGMKGVFAAPGSYIPGTGITLKTTEVRGVASAGMLLSAREMGLGDDHTGIIDLPEDAPVGLPYPQYAGLDDPVFDIAITPNRGDCFSVRGVARDLAAAGIGTLRPWNPEPVPPVFACPGPRSGDGGLRWQIDWPEACPWILGRTIRNLRNTESPDWLARRLTAIGLRPINALVDVTNFFTFDLGRPLHVFDTAKVAGDVLTLRRGAGETFRALNGKDYILTPEDCAIADAAGVQSMAGVMGGEVTGCDETTSSVFIECALFDPVRVALTGRRHQVTSDARQRFEHGIDPAIMPAAVEAATRLILDICGGEPGPVVSAGHRPDWHRTASLRFARLAEFGGADVPPEEAVTALERLGFSITSRDKTQVTVSVPSWRNDIAPGVALDQAPGLGEAGAKAAAGCAQVEPEADLIEEILRLRSLDTVTPVSLPRAAPVPLPTLTPRQTRAALARRTLAAQGLVECVTFSFMSAKEAALFGETPPELRVSNPIAADLDQMRPTPLATLVLAAQRNAARGWPDLGLFEIGPAFTPSGQTLVATGLRTGSTPRNWAEPSRAVDALDAKADLFSVLQVLAVPLDALSITSDAPSFYHPGRSGVVRQGPRTILGIFGELHPSFDLTGPAVAFELFLDVIPDPKRRRRSAPDLPSFQPVRRDFAFVVDTSVPADAVLRAVKGADRALITSVILFDRYEGPNIPVGKTSLAIEVTFQPRDHTLTDAELEAAAAKVVSTVARATGAELR